MAIIDWFSRSYFLSEIADGLLPNTVRLIHTMLFTAFKDAINMRFHDLRHSYLPLDIFLAYSF
jgi:hypothetical protein